MFINHSCILAPSSKRFNGFNSSALAGDTRDDHDLCHLSAWFHVSAHCNDVFYVRPYLPMLV